MAWGLEIAADRVRLCRADLRRGRIQLRRAAEAPLPAGAVRASVKDANVSDAAALTTALHRLVRRAGCRGWVRLALPDPVFILRTLATDELPEDRTAARRFLAWQARDLLPFPAEHARLDFLRAGSGSDGRLRLTCLISNGRVLAEYERILHNVGLLPAVTDARSVALAQAASALLAFPSVGLLTADGGRATLLVLHEGRPRLWRILAADDGAGGNGVRLIREVADSLVYFQETEDLGQLQHFFVHGMGSRTTEIASGLNRWLEVDVSVLDLSEALTSGEAPRGLTDELTQWGAALGAAIRPW
jgi:Tfp pilus assembly PilM family ATPase